MESPGRGGRRRRRRCRRRADGEGDADGLDHISGLPDELLLQILARLGCARAAAVTSVLSHRWRGLWRQLPELSFRDITPDALDAALAQAALTELSLLDIHVPEQHRYSAARVASLLGTAARLAPVDLRLVVWGDVKDCLVAIEVPFFHRATSIKLVVRNLYLTPPAQASAGEFPVLERLYMTGCTFDLGGMIPRCPSLLEVCYYGNIREVVVHSTTIEKLVVNASGWIRSVDVVAPALKEFALDAYMDKDFSVSFSAPMMEDLQWSCLCDYQNVGIGEMWRLHHLHLWMEESVYGLDLSIDIMRHPFVVRSLMEDIAQLPEISVLKLYLASFGHVFGAMVLNLLGVCITIRRLTVNIQQPSKTDGPCPPNCPCDQPENWRGQNISLMALEEVEIQNFEGNSHEVDFLKLLFRCAPLLKRVSVKLSPNVLPSCGGCKEIYNIFKANPYVKCYFYCCSGKKVVYA